MRCIMLAMDFTDLSQRALTTAHDMSCRLALPLQLVHVVEPIEDPAAADDDSRQFHAHLEERARQKLEEAARTLQGDVSWAVYLGHRAEELLRLAQEREALLVLGCPRVDKTDAPWLGISQQVVWSTPQPVLLVP